MKGKNKKERAQLIGLEPQIRKKNEGYAPQSGCFSRFTCS
jgi:hypothetical protein